MSFRTVKAISAFVLLAVVFFNGVFAAEDEQQLIVQVVTDKVNYQAGDSVVIEARTFLDGEPMAAIITEALVTLTLPDGRVVKSNIASDFQMIEPGVYVASGVVKAPGQREIEVKAAIKKKVIVACGCQCKCKIKVIKSQGFASYAVEGKPLAVGITSERSAFSICEKAQVKISLDQGADVRLLIVFPHGVQRDLVIPGWLGPGDHWITFTPSKFDVGLVTVKVVAMDRYGQQAVDEVAITFQHGICDC